MGLQNFSTEFTDLPVDSICKDKGKLFSNINDIEFKDKESPPLKEPSYIIDIDDDDEEAYDK